MKTVVGYSCIFKDCSEQGPRQGKAKEFSVFFRSDS